MHLQRLPFWKVFRKRVEGKRRSKCSFRLEKLLSSGKGKANKGAPRSKASSPNYRSEPLNIDDRTSVDRELSTILKACRCKNRVKETRLRLRLRLTEGQIRNMPCVSRQSELDVHTTSAMHLFRIMQ